MIRDVQAFDISGEYNKLQNNSPLASNKNQEALQLAQSIADSRNRNLMATQNLAMAQEKLRLQQNQAKIDETMAPIELEYRRAQARKLNFEANELENRAKGIYTNPKDLEAAQAMQQQQNKIAQINEIRNGLYSTNPNQVKATVDKIKNSDNVLRQLSTTNFDTSKSSTRNAKLNYDQSIGLVNELLFDSGLLKKVNEDLTAGNTSYISKAGLSSGIGFGAGSKVANLLSDKNTKNIQFSPQTLLDQKIGKHATNLLFQSKEGEDSIAEFYRKKFGVVPTRTELNDFKTFLQNTIDKNRQVMSFINPETLTEMGENKTNANIAGMYFGGTAIGERLMNSDQIAAAKATQILNSPEAKNIALQDFVSQGQGQGPGQMPGQMPGQDQGQSQMQGPMSIQGPGQGPGQNQGPLSDSQLRQQMAQVNPNINNNDPGSGGSMATNFDSSPSTNPIAKNVEMDTARRNEVNQKISDQVIQDLDTNLETNFTNHFSNHELFANEIANLPERSENSFLKNAGIVSRIAITPVLDDIKGVAKFFISNPEYLQTVDNIYNGIINKDVKDYEEDHPWISTAAKLTGTVAEVMGVGALGKAAGVAGLLGNTGAKMAQGLEAAGVAKKYANVIMGAAEGATWGAILDGMKANKDAQVDETTQQKINNIAKSVQDGFAINAGIGALFGSKELLIGAKKIFTNKGTVSKGLEAVEKGVKNYETGIPQEAKKLSDVSERLEAAQSSEPTAEQARSLLESQRKLRENAESVTGKIDKNKEGIVKDFTKGAREDVKAAESKMYRPEDVEEFNIAKRKETDEILRKETEATYKEAYESMPKFEMENKAQLQGTGVERYRGQIGTALRSVEKNGFKEEADQYSKALDGLSNKENPIENLDDLLKVYRDINENYRGDRRLYEGLRPLKDTIENILNNATNGKFAETNVLYQKKLALDKVVGTRNRKFEPGQPEAIVKPYENLEYKTKELRERILSGDYVNLDIVKPETFNRMVDEKIGDFFGEGIKGKDTAKKLTELTNFRNKYFDSLSRTGKTEIIDNAINGLKQQKEGLDGLRAFASKISEMDSDQVYDSFLRSKGFKDNQEMISRVNDNEELSKIYNDLKTASEVTTNLTSNIDSAFERVVGKNLNQYNQEIRQFNRELEEVQKGIDKTKSKVEIDSLNAKKRMIMDKLDEYAKIFDHPEKFIDDVLNRHFEMEDRSGFAKFAKYSKILAFIYNPLKALASFSGYYGVKGLYRSTTRTAAKEAMMKKIESEMIAKGLNKEQFMKLQSASGLKDMMTNSFQGLLFYQKVLLGMLAQKRSDLLIKEDR